MKRKTDPIYRNTVHYFSWLLWQQSNPTVGSHYNYSCFWPLLPAIFPPADSAQHGHFWSGIKL